MASCNGAYPSTSAICNSNFNVGLSGSEEWSVVPRNSDPARLGRLGTSRFDNISFGSGTEDGAYGSLLLTGCSACLNGEIGTSRCQDCIEILCNACSALHISENANHNITNLADSPTFLSLPHSTSSSGLHTVHNGHVTGSPLSVMCDMHRQEALLFCMNCKILACQECPLQHPPHHSVIALPENVQRVKKDNEKLLEQVLYGINVMEKESDRFCKLQHRMNTNVREVTDEIVCTVRKLKELLEQRASRLMSEARRRYEENTSFISRQKQITWKKREELQSMANQLTHASKTLKLSDLINANKEAFVRLKSMLESKRVTLSCEYDKIQFVQAQEPLMSGLSSFGIICSSGCACKTVARGRALNCAAAGIYNSVTVNVFDHQGNMCLQPPEKFPLSVQLLLPDGRRDGHLYVNWSDGIYVIKYKAQTCGLHRLHIKLHGEHIVDSPFTVNISKPRTYQGIGHPEYVFGEAGKEDGKLCRPWGVCCDIDKNIIVADRSNNRIQIFRPDGTFYYKFGVFGTEAGQFNRPAGIASDTKRRIVVADKDNHRIQVFKRNGEFIFMFGEYGNRQGQFYYPWDVDVNSVGEIVVSDTRNHRIQLFSAVGKFIRKFCYGTSGPMIKQFDYPRGVCFGNNGEVIVTDFNNHSIVVLDSLLSHAQRVGKNGNGPAEFQRPSGICVDQLGNIIVADSKNHRIQIFGSNGCQLRNFGTLGAEPGELNSPTDVCISPDGKIVVLDFGNSRVQVF